VIPIVKSSETLSRTLVDVIVAIARLAGSHAASRRCYTCLVLRLTLFSSLGNVTAAAAAAADIIWSSLLLSVEAWQVPSL